MEKRAANIERETPDHAVGAYRAWMLPAESGPCDMVWFCAPSGETTARHRVLPLGEPSLALWRRRAADGTVLDAKFFICGPHSKPFWNEASPFEEMIALRLKPESCGSVLSVAPREFENQPATELDDTFRAQMQNTLHVLDRNVRTVYQAMLFDMVSLSTQKKGEAKSEHYAADMLRQSNGAAPIKEIAEFLSISERHLRRRFKDSVGCSPKDYARRLRLANAAIMADARTAPHWADIAVAAGYHDQSHMIAEFQSLIGLSPRALHAERRAEIT